METEDEYWKDNYVSLDERQLWNQSEKKSCGLGEVNEILVCNDQVELWMNEEVELMYLDLQERRA